MSTSTDHRYRTAARLASAWLGLGLLCVLAGCGKKDTAGAVSSWSQKDADLEYRLIRSEIKLSEATKPYIVLNLHDKRVQLRLKGMVVWDYMMELVDTDDGELRDFSVDFAGDKQTLVRPVLEQYLFAAAAQTPDSVLTIISEATNFDKSLLQRELPTRFQLRWAGGLVLDVRTDVEGQETSSFKNKLRDLQQSLARPFGHEIIAVKMPKEVALTLYRVARPGVPTLLIPA